MTRPMKEKENNRKYVNRIDVYLGKRMVGSYGFDGIHGGYSMWCGLPRIKQHMGPFKTGGEARDVLIMAVKHWWNKATEEDE